MDTELEVVLISALNQFVFCPRRCALMHVEGIWADNSHTTVGSMLHLEADKPGHASTEGIITVKALALFSLKYGIAGRADVVEWRDGVPAPVEYKKGRRRRFDNDDVQLCAQGLCLEEMFGVDVPVGYIFHATSRHRREVLFDWQLRQETGGVIQAVRAMLQSGHTPPAILRPRCDGCSLHGICLPRVSGSTPTIEQERYCNDLWR